MPAKAGIQANILPADKFLWIPACAGMTEETAAVSVKVFRKISFSKIFLPHRRRIA